MHDRFERVRKLGQGTYGEVFLARERATDKLFAIKVLIQPTLEAREQFEREARHLDRNIRNRHVVDLIEAHLDSTPPYLVLEYCEGGSLLDMPKPVSWYIAAHMLLHACAGLFDIHRATGFHRDLKPGNLLLARDPQLGWVVKVADWGLARTPFTVGMGMTRGPGGTPGYIAPEVLMGDLFDAKADIYSLGVVALELLTGSRSLAAMTQIEMPSRLRSLVERMSSKAPANRPDITEALGELAEVIKAISLVTPEIGAEGSDVTSEPSSVADAAPSIHRPVPPPVQPLPQPQAAAPRPAVAPRPHVAPAAAAAPSIPAAAAVQDVWIDAATLGARIASSTRLPLARLAGGPGDFGVYGFRDSPSAHVIVPAAAAAMAFRDASGQTGTTTCSHIRLPLTAEPRSGAMALVIGSVIFPSTARAMAKRAALMSPTNPPVTAASPLQAKSAQGPPPLPTEARVVRVSASLSQTSQDTGPRLGRRGAAATAIGGKPFAAPSAAGKLANRRRSGLTQACTMSQLSSGKSHP